ncbi:MAG: pyridoxamine 5'-phosphate oxidase [Betaproteobacteria bacterium]|nr:pyridoxamine 5'-phosphate oxidase [Betaproteobacteria bacterium]
MSDAQKTVAELRREYARDTLDESQVAPDPFDQFGRWFAQARQSDLTDANAMTLATSDAENRPSARIVLLKDFDARGFVFFTNYDSRKGHDLAYNPSAALLFYWHALERQIRIEGSIEKISAIESDEYFQSRPLGASLGAWASPQSEVVPSRAFLEQRFADFTQRYESEPPRPAHWGGYRIKPNLLEFWQGRPDRMHDRIRYRMQNEMRWEIERLAP